MAYCFSCGSRLETDESFCANCGKSQQVGGISGLVRQPTQGTRRKWLHFGLVGLVAIAFIIGVVILLTPPDIYGVYYFPHTDLPEEYRDLGYMVMESLEIKRDGTLYLNWSSPGESLNGEGRTLGGTWIIVDDEILVMIEETPIIRGRKDGNRIVLYCPETGKEIIATRQ